MMISCWPNILSMGHVADAAPKLAAGTPHVASVSGEFTKELGISAPGGAPTIGGSVSGGVLPGQNQD